MNIYTDVSLFHRSFIPSLLHLECCCLCLSFHSVYSFWPHSSVSHTWLCLDMRDDQIVQITVYRMSRARVFYFSIVCDLCCFISFHSIYLHKHFDDLNSSCVHFVGFLFLFSSLHILLLFSTRCVVDFVCLYGVCVYMSSVLFFIELLLLSLFCCCCHYISFDIFHFIHSIDVSFKCRCRCRTARMSVVIYKTICNAGALCASFSVI